MKIPRKDAEVIDLGAGEGKCILVEISDELDILLEIYAKACGVTAEQYFKWVMLEGIKNGE